jgi:uncharacterized membrane protein
MPERRTYWSNNFGVYKMEKATFGLDENIASALTYVLTFLTGIIFFLVEKENKTVRFHAMQSIITFLGLFIVFIVISFIPFVNMLAFLVWILEIILWLVLIIKAYQGEKFKLPIVGDMAESYV